MVALCYVDDCLFFGPDGAEIDKVITEMRADNMPLTEENKDDVFAFLGVDIAPIPGEQSGY